MKRLFNKHLFERHEQRTPTSLAVLLHGQEVKWNQYQDNWGFYEAYDPMNDTMVAIKESWTTVVPETLRESLYEASKIDSRASSILRHIEQQGLSDADLLQIATFALMREVTR